MTVRVIEDLPDYPIVDIQTVARCYDGAPQSAHAALVRLEAAGILSDRAFAPKAEGPAARRMLAATESIDLLAE